VTRFFFLLALAMMAYFLLRGRLARLLRPETKDRPTSRPPASNAPPASPTRNYESADVVADPVCGTFVDPAVAVSVTHGSKRFYFCSEACRDMFLADPK